MILVQKFLNHDETAAIVRGIVNAGFRSVVTPFQPEPALLSGESLDAALQTAISAAVERGIRSHPDPFQPNRVECIAGPDFLRFLDGMSLGYSPVRALHNAQTPTGKMRCDSLLHVCLSDPAGYTGGDMQINSSDRPGQRLQLAAGDAVLLGWDDIFALRVVHKGPLYHLILRFQYDELFSAMEAERPLSTVSMSQDPEIAVIGKNLLQRVSLIQRSRKAPLAPPTSGEII